MKQNEALKLALEAAEIGLANLTSYQSTGKSPTIHEYGQAARALAKVRKAKEALSQEQEPVAWVWVNNKGWLNYGETPHDMFKSSPLYPHPPQRTWVGLTDEEVRQMCGSVPSMREAVRETEAKLKEKNT